MFKQQLESLMYSGAVAHTGHSTPPQNAKPPKSTHFVLEKSVNVEGYFHVWRRMSVGEKSTQSHVFVVSGLVLSVFAATSRCVPFEAEPIYTIYKSQVPQNLDQFNYTLYI